VLVLHFRLVSVALTVVLTKIGNVVADFHDGGAWSCDAAEKLEHLIAVIEFALDWWYTCCRSLLCLL
jgi:hypothetical protein